MGQPIFLRLTLLAFALFLLSIGQAQMLVQTSYSAEHLVKEVLAGKETGLTIEQVNYQGSQRSLGLFEMVAKYNDLIKKGIILSTGDAFQASGPNTVPNMGERTSLRRDPELEPLASGKTFDAVSLEFDLIPRRDSLVFNFIFASEEYPEYVNKNVNDVFAFFLTNTKTGEKVNLAVLPGTNTPITVDNINAGKNPQFFMKNGIWDNANIEQWRNNRTQGELAFNFQYDGLTTLLTAGARVVPNQPYHLKLAIADVGDPFYDSAIFLEAGSLAATGQPAESTGQDLTDLVTAAFADRATNEDSVMRVRLQILFDYNSFAIQGEQSFGDLDKVVEVLKADPLSRVDVLGHTDNHGSEVYNLELSRNRAKQVAAYLEKKGIPAHRIQHEGFGESQPVDPLDRAANRRVEFVFRSASN